MLPSPVAEKLNSTIIESNNNIYEMLSNFGKRMYFPKGIVSQSQEASKKAHLYNATIGIATEKNQAMFLNSVKSQVEQHENCFQFFPYASSYGVPELRKSWQIHQRKINKNITQSSFPIVTNALTHGLSLVGDLFINANDNVLLPNLFWGNYKLMWEIKNQGNFNHFSLFKNDLSGLDLSDFSKQLNNIKSQKIIVVLNFPNNPSGYSPTIEESNEIKTILKEAADKGKHIIAICDDAYSGLTYESNCEKESLFGDLANCSKNLLAIKIDGCSKEFFMWGFRIGFVTFGNKSLTSEAYDALEQKLGGSVRGSVSNINHIGQRILLKTLKNEESKEEINEKKNILEERYHLVKEIVNHKKYLSCWSPYPFNSGYFMCLKLKENINSETLRLHLLEKYGLGTISIGQQDLRIAYSCIEKDNIEEVFRTIYKGVQDILK